MRLLSNSASVTAAARYLYFKKFRKSAESLIFKKYDGWHELEALTEILKCPDVYIDSQLLLKEEMEKIYIKKAEK